ncbi:MAG: hypothetical protein IJE12_07950 [Prevotella sp.]|nr:hypothetical protein [Prevotella sp.]
MVNQLLNKNRIYVCDEDFDFVYDFIRQAKPHEGRFHDPQGRTGGQGNAEVLHEDNALTLQGEHKMRSRPKKPAPHCVANTRGYPN